MGTVTDDHVHKAVTDSCFGDTVFDADCGTILAGKLS